MKKIGAHESAIILDELEREVEQLKQRVAVDEQALDRLERDEGSSDLVLAFCRLISAREHAILTFEFEMSCVRRDCQSPDALDAAVTIQRRISKS